MVVILNKKKLILGMNDPRRVLKHVGVERLSRGSEDGARRRRTQNTCSRLELLSAVDGKVGRVVEEEKGRGNLHNFPGISASADRARERKDLVPPRRPNPTSPRRSVSSPPPPSLSLRGSSFSQCMYSSCS